MIAYQDHSNWQMIKYGIQYIFSKSFMKKAEYDADQHAIDHGFSKQIIASKLFVLDNDEVDDSYKNKFKKFYPSVDEVKLSAEEQKPMEPSSRTLRY